METARLVHPDVGRHSFSTLAAALRRSSAGVLDEWERRVRQDIPRVTAGLKSNELRVNLPEFLGDLADVVAGAPNDKLIEEGGPARGLRRFHQHFELRELLASERHLWGALLSGVCASLARPMSAAEVSRLRDAFDDFMRASLLAYAHCEQTRARDAADAELKRLAFLSHDLNNTLNETCLGLALLRGRLENSPASATEAGRVRDVERAIADTIHGMRQLLEHERLRKAGVRPAVQPVDVGALTSRVTAQFAPRLQEKRLTLQIEAPPEAVVESDPDLLAIILRNLVGNATKYSQKGTIRVRLEFRTDGDRDANGEGDVDSRGRCVLSVSDEGPGIDPERLKDIFEAFRRGTPAEPPDAAVGMGLGLAIAREAAKALAAELTVESRLGVGAIFRLHFGTPVCHASVRTGP